MLQATQKQVWDRTAKMRDALYCVFFFCMPFTQALTFSIGFPLKFSELALVLLGFIYLTLHRKVALPRPVIYLLALFFAVVTISIVYNLFRHFSYPLRTFETRFGYTGDTLSRYIYFLLALLTFFVSTDIFLSDHRQRYINAWIYGALFAAVYSWHLSVFSFLKLPVLLLPGMPQNPQAIAAFGREFIRSGTFLEGNMMGLYLIVSAAISFYIRKTRSGIFLLISILPTFSTLSILCIFIFLLIYLQRIIFRRKYLSYVLPGLAIFSIAFFLFSRTTLYDKYVYKKLFSSTKKVEDVSAYSKADRLFSIQDAWRMGQANPALGVGLANYSRHYDRYMDASNIDSNFVKTLLRPGLRVIPNNIYLEVWAETGGIALLLFILLLCLLTKYSIADKTRALLPGMVCLLICFIAYPSFIMIYIWAFLALPAADYIRTRQKKPA